MESLLFVLSAILGALLLRRLRDRLPRPARAVSRTPRVIRQVRPPRRRTFDHDFL
ncbi:MAG: hypothetical protein ACOZCP_10750 [Pseudomonadota bacterium]